VTGPLPPCIVLGVETQIGLAIVRELGRAGVVVIGIAQQANAIGLASRHLARGVVVDAPRSPALIALIERLGGEHPGACLLAVSEVNMLWLLAHRDAFRSVVPILPDPAALAVALDKQRTLDAAIAVGIRVPLSVEPTSLADAETMAPSFPFPAVLKWKDPAAIAPRLAAHGLELVKAEYVYNAAGFIAVARRYAPLDAWPLVQEYCPGQGLGQFFFMYRGQAVRRFQHRRVAEWPPEGGYSSVCDGVDLVLHAELQERSIALLQRIGWEGVAMVEYRHDPVTGIARLMEINGRFWGSFPLAAASGAGFALLAHALQGCGRMPALAPLRSDIRCRMVVTELKRLVRIVFQPGRIEDRRYRPEPAREVLRFAVDFFRPGVRYFVWSWDDPMPFVRDVRNMFAKAANAVKAVTERLAARVRA
jgi:predicted ATP-grasp superfamily ATP-dependent carboligase